MLWHPPKKRRISATTACLQKYKKAFQSAELKKKHEEEEMVQMRAALLQKLFFSLPEGPNGVRSRYVAQDMTLRHILQGPHPERQRVDAT